MKTEKMMDRASVCLVLEFSHYKGKTDDFSPKNFIEMCSSITHMHDSDEKIYSRFEGIVNDSLKGVQAVAVSMMLH